MTFDQFAYYFSAGCVMIIFITQSVIQVMVSGEKIVEAKGFHPLVKGVARIACILLAAIIILMARHEGSFLRLSLELPLELRACGLGLNVASVILFLWSHMKLGKNWSGRVRIRKNHELITSGPFEYVRHPLYLALFLLMIGITISLDVVFGFALLIVGFLVYDRKARQEEELLRRYFWGKYQFYQERTWRFFPYLY